MKILHSLFTRGIGGTERHLAELANAQAASGNSVGVLMRGDRRPDGRTDPFPGWLAPEVEIIPVAARWPLPAMMRTLRRFRPDIVHTHHGRDGRYLTLAAQPWSIPAVATLHMEYRHKDYRRHDGLICVSQWQMGNIPEALRVRSAVIPNWVRQPPAVSEERRRELRARAGAGEGEWLIGAVGRLYPEKGMDLLAAAFLDAAPPGCRLAIFGEGEMRGALEKIVAAHGGDIVRLMGYEEDIRPWYSAFDLFVMPSRREPFGLALLEAMAGGCPILATCTAGARDILGGNPWALWAEPGSAESLARALRDAAPLMGRRRDYPELQNHDYARAAERVLEFYGSLGAGAGR